MDITRLEAEVCALEQEKSTGAVLFYGNSYFAFWDTAQIAATFPEFPVCNHGFGGATSAELHHYYDRLVRPYAPSALIWTEGANDWEQGFSVEEASELAVRTLDRARADFPHLPIVILSAVETLKGEQLGAIPYARTYSENMRRFAMRKDALYVDLQPFFYADGALRKNLFREDITHLNPEGYAIFSAYVREKTIKFLKERTVCQNSSIR